MLGYVLIKCIRLSLTKRRKITFKLNVFSRNKKIKEFFTLVLKSVKHKHFTYFLTYYLYVLALGNILPLINA